MVKVDNISQIHSWFNGQDIGFFRNLYPFFPADSEDPEHDNILIPSIHKRVQRHIIDRPSVNIRFSMKFFILK